MQPKDLLEELAQHTWQMIAAAAELGLAWPEETITVQHMLAMRARGRPFIHVIPSNKPQEARYGFDWLWFVGTPVDGWWAYAIQAKRIDSAGVYRYLRHAVNRKQQWKLLSDYSKVHGCVPLYCFFNGQQSAAARAAWHCSEVFDESQLGCTLAPLEIVRPFIRRGRTGTFATIHESDRVLPWRCIVACSEVNPLGHRVPHPLASQGFEGVRSHPRLPSYVADTLGYRYSGAGIDVEEGARWEADGGPRATVVFDISQG